MCEYDCNICYDEIMVTVEEVTNAIKKLDVNNACGSDGIIMFRTYNICRQGTCSLAIFVLQCFVLLMVFCQSQCCQLYLCQ